MTTSDIWLTSDLRNEIKFVFEPKYGHQLNEVDVVAIAENLTGYMETIIKWNMKYEKAGLTRENIPHSQA
jgi:hypothetical protein